MENIDFTNCSLKELIEVYNELNGFVNNLSKELETLKEESDSDE